MKNSKTKFFGLDVNDPKTESKILVFVVRVWSGSAIILSLIFWFNSDRQGVFGDMFGAVNALFSGLAFAGIIYTILLQREDLKTQADILTLTKDEIRTQSNTFLKDQFENRFFHLLAQHELIIKSIDVDIRLKGRSYLNEYHQSFLSTFGNGTRNPEDMSECRIKYLETYHEIFERHLTSYIGSVKTLLLFIDRVDVETFDNDKMFYYSIFENQLTFQEKVIIYYHACFTTDIEFKRLYQNAQYQYHIKEKHLDFPAHLKFINIKT